MRMCVSSCFAVWLSLATVTSALVIDEPNIGMSKRIPKEGDVITWQIPLLNETEQTLDGDVTVSMRAARFGDALTEIDRKSVALHLEPGVAADVAFTWRPESNGHYRVVFEISDPDQSVRREVAVTKEDLYFVWFGAPKAFRWCNVPTTVTPEDRAWWLRRGALPAGWKGGVCYKDWPLERFVESWGDTDWIGIDEVGGPGETTDTFIEAWKQLKQSKPDQFVAVWFMGAHTYWAEIKDLVDLFVPEIYLNYGSNHLGQFDAYLRTARETGVMDQVIPGLGINQIMAEGTKRVTTSPTKADVLRQIRYLKRTAPELKGIGFFTSDNCAWGVAEYADELCGEYYVKPVLTIQHPDNPIRLSQVAEDGTRSAWLALANVGGMDSTAVALEWRFCSADGNEIVRHSYLDRVACGTTVDVSVAFQQELGWLSLEARLVPGDQFTVLDGTASTIAVRLPEENDAVTSVAIAAGIPHPATRLRTVDIGTADTVSTRIVDRHLNTVADLPCAVLPPRPGRTENLVAFPLDSRLNTPQVVVLTPKDPSPASPPDHGRTGDRLRIANDYYEAELDLATDVLVSLSPRGSGANLFTEGWGLAVTGHDGMGSASVSPGPGCLVVTIPYSSAQASGESQYVFFRDSPAIRIARLWTPREGVTTTTAAERCHLHQNGGTFALQPGVGGTVQRGRLHDGSAYRDLLFGYLGGRPGPDNAERAGWLDFSYGETGIDGGMGVVIDYRWQDSDTTSYDVTRLYDANDWLEVLFLWGKEKTFTRAQTSCLYLVPHRRLDFTDPETVPPAKILWEEVHRKQLTWIKP